MRLDAFDISPDEARQRFRWAERQGNPAWLWPEIAPAVWREGLQQIETAIRAILSGRTGRLEGEPESIGLAGYTSGVGPLLGWWRERSRLNADRDISDLLDLHLRHNRSRAERLDAAAVLLVEALLADGIPVAILKGAHTARAYFPEPGVRPASDIDLLVHGGDAGRAEAALARSGFFRTSRAARESTWRHVSAPLQPRSLRLAHADDPWSVDLHTSLDLVVSAGAPLARLDALEPMTSCKRWEGHPGALALDQPALLLHLAVHAGSGLHNSTLLRLVEIVLVVRHDVRSGALSWDAFLRRGEAAGLLGFAYPALRLAQDLCPGLIPAAVMSACERHAPSGVLHVLERLTPATAQRIDRRSLGEHFMWSRSWPDRIRQLGSDIVPAAGSWEKLWSIYERRAWRLIRGGFSP